MFEARLGDKLRDIGVCCKRLSNRVVLMMSKFGTHLLVRHNQSQVRLSGCGRVVSVSVALKRNLADKRLATDDDMKQAVTSS